MTLFGPDGFELKAPVPGPNPFTEERVNKELQSLDSLLHIRWVENVYANQTTQQMEGRYAMCCHWPKVDKRWEEVRSGGCDPAAAFDIMGWFCEDIHDANTVPQDPESIMHKMMELLHNADNERQPWAERMAGTAQHNKDLKKQKVKDAGDLAERAVKEVVGIKSLRYGKKTNDPSRLDHAEGMRRELEEELGIEPVEEARDEQRFEEERGDS